MQTILLVPKQGQASTIGFGPILFTSPTAPILAVGDTFYITLIGQTPNRDMIGYMMPWENSPHYAGKTDGQGNLMIVGQSPTGGPVSIFDGVGITLATGVYPGGGINPFGAYYPFQLGAPGPPPAPPVAGLPALIAAVKASWQSHIPVADWLADADPNVTYVYAPPYYAAPTVEHIGAAYALGDAAAAKIAQIAGWTVKKEAPPDIACPAPFNDIKPAVNWFYGTVDGVAKKAIAAEVARSFSLGNTPETTIPAVFQTV